MRDKVLFVGPLERVLYLRSLPAAQGLSSDHLASIARHAKERTFASGEYLFRSGVPVESFYVVVDGIVEVQRGSGQPQRLGPEETVGFLHLVARGGQGLTARAETETLALEFPGESQLDLWESHFDILASYFRYLLSLTISVIDQAAVPRERQAPTHPISGARLDLVDKLGLLATLSEFQNCSLDALGEVCRHARTRELEAGRQLWTMGSDAEHFLLLTAGELLQRSQTRQSPIRPPALVGLEEALSSRLRWYELEASRQSTILEIRIESFLDILEDHFEMSVEFMANLARRLLKLLYD